MTRNCFTTLAAALACLGTLLPPSALADPPEHSAAMRTADIALGTGGLLVGHVVDREGAPQAGAIVAIHHGQHEVVRTTTDANGVFAAQGLRGGQYQLITDNGQAICRLWAVDTAPPAAQPTALVVTGDEIVRGQFGYNPAHSWVEWIKAHPYLTAGTVAAAIAIPLAFADDWSSGS